MSKLNKEVPIKFHGIDYWNRPVYKNVDAELYFGSLNILFPDKAIAPNGTTEEINAFFKVNIEQLEYFGTTFDEHDPLGGLPYWIKLKIVE